MDRRARHATATSSYYRHKFAWLQLCVYCGEPATERDHVLPVSIAAGLDLRRAGVRREVRGGLWTVPACGECNRIAGGVAFTSILGKRRYIQRRLRKRYQRDLAAVMWSPEELEELGPTLRSAVESRLQRVIRLQLRLSWPAARTHAEYALVSNLGLVERP